MDALRSIVPLALLAAAVDTPWLLTIGERAQKMTVRVQGGAPFVPRWWAGIIVYLAIGYLISRTGNPVDAFGLGTAVYAVYDFTNLAILSKYELEFAVMDTIWGGTLFALTKAVADWLRV